MKEISRSFLIILILSGLCLLISQNACPALALDKDKIIEQISAGYEKMNTFSASFIQESNFQSKKTQGKGMISYERPYGLRVEVVVDAADNGLKNLSLFDGQIFWQEQRKTTGEVLRVIKSVLDLSEAYSQQIIRQFDIGFQFEGIKKQYEAVSVAKEKEGKTNVYVLTMRLKPEENEKMQKMFKSFGVEDVLQILPQQTIYYWDIDKKFCKKVKILNAKEEVISSVIYDDIKVNEELDKKLFSYSPPEGVEVFDATEILKREFKEKELDGAENKMAGQDAPAFKLTDLKGTEYDYEKIKGKILVIDFWAHWCPPCQKELPLIEKFYQDYLGEKDVDVLTITNEQEESKNIVEENGYSFPVLIDADGSVSGSFGVSTIPRIFVIDQQGKIAAVYIGFHEDIKDILAKDIARLRGE